jgi:hypothetical protein
VVATESPSLDVVAEIDCRLTTVLSRCSRYVIAPCFSAKSSRSLAAIPDRP